MMVAEVIALATPLTIPYRRPARITGRPPLALTLALAVITAVVLLRAAAVLSSPGLPSESDRATAALIDRYYAALNEAIATGDTSSFDALIAADALGSDGPEGAAALRDLGRRLAALHASRATLRLDTERVVAGADEAVAWVSLTGGAPGGVVVHGDGLRALLLDGFRLHDGRIMEAWGGTPGLDVPIPVIGADVAPFSTEAAVGLARLELAPEAALPPLMALGPMVVAVETGSARARLHGSGWLTRVGAGTAPGVETRLRGAAVILEPGDQLALGVGARLELSDAGREPAVVMVAAVFPAWATDPVDYAKTSLEPHSWAVNLVRDLASADAAAVHWPDGVAVQRLVGQEIELPGTETVRLGVERADLAPGAVLAAFRPAGPAIVAVERGVVSITGVRSDQVARGVEIGTTTLLAVGGTATAELGDAVTVRNAGDEPAVVVALLVAPVG